MVQLRTRRVALALYGVLLVLPTAVLGGLQWYEIVRSHQGQMAAVPGKADDAARRLREMVSDRLERLVGAEDGRPLTDYAERHLPASLGGGSRTLLPSPLVQDVRPQGMQGWFTFDRLDGAEAPIELFWGGPADRIELPDRQLAVREAVRDILLRSLDVDAPGYLGDLPVERNGSLPLRSLAVARGAVEGVDCAQGDVEAWDDRLVAARWSRVHLLFHRDASGWPWVLGVRRATIDPIELLPGEEGACLRSIARGHDLFQGFLLDPHWIFDELPASVSRSVLDPTQRFVARDVENCCQGRIEYHAEIYLVQDLGLEIRDEQDLAYAPLKVAVDTGHLESHFRTQTWRFFGMAGMLVLSLATGLLLLLRSVTRDLEQAERTENFVAAVTHELRTPLSAIKLHGEMLLDGWATEELKQREYYRRIVRETGRLSTLVERVLEKSRLASASVKPVPVDLERTLHGLRGQLTDSMTSMEDDLDWDLAGDLPAVRATPDSVASIVVNLVENARKYAPARVGEPGGEPIRIGTRRVGERIVLEISDRGPGIAPEERNRIFDAFYRVGSESTRRTRGTGLGLHLVALQAESIGARVDVEPRSGGGTTFRVSFAVARA